MREIKTYSKGAPFYNAFHRTNSSKGRESVFRNQQKLEFDIAKIAISSS